LCRSRLRATIRPEQVPALTRDGQEAAPFRVPALDQQAAASAAADRPPQVALADSPEAQDEVAAGDEAVVAEGDDRLEDLLVARQWRHRPRLSTPAAHGGLETRRLWVDVGDRKSLQGSASRFTGDP
jgi:hypothetical protein